MMKSTNIRRLGFQNRSWWGHPALMASVLGVAFVITPVAADDAAPATESNVSDANPFAEEGEDGFKPNPKQGREQAHDHEHDDDAHDHEHPPQAEKKRGFINALVNWLGGAPVQAEPAMAMEIEEEVIDVIVIQEPEIADASLPLSLDTGNSLTIDGDQQRRLTRAHEFAQEGRYDLAVPLWQKVLDEAGDQLAVGPGHDTLEQYKLLSPVSSRIEAEIAALPPRGLREYRVHADPEAAGLLGRARRNSAVRETALSEVVLKYFMSSMGDNATFELACLKLEREEFYAALQLLEKLNHYPDSDIPRAQILVRLAVAQGRIGDEVAADSTLEQLGAMNTTSTRVVSLVSEDVKTSVTANAGRSVNVEGWPTRLGTFAHDGHMAALKDGQLPSGLSEIWQHRPEYPMVGIPDLPENAPKIHMSTNGQTKQMIYINGVVIDPDVYAKERAKVVTHRQIIAGWKKRGGRLAGELLLVDGRVYLDGGDRIVCCDLESGDVIWQGHPNQFQVDETSKTSLLMKIADQRYGYQALQTRFGTSTELQLFGDHIHHAMTLAHGMLFTIEGDLEDHGAPPVNQQEQMNWWQAQQQGIQRKRTNWLTAYDAKGGKLKWNRTAAPNGTDRTQAGFLCAPVASRDHLLVPVTTDGKCWLFALNPTDGSTTWRAFLGDEPISTNTHWSRASVAVDAGEAFVATGIGTTYCVDVTTGTVKWGVQYTRNNGSNGAAPNAGQNPFLMRGADVQPNPKTFNETLNDTVIVTGNKVIVMASDFDKVFAIHRSSGKILWHQPLASGNRGPYTYCLGIHRGMLFMGGPTSVQAIGIDSGKSIWDCALSHSFGRGAVTEDALFVPDGGDIVQISLEKGDVVGKTPVVSTTGEPIGNLYSDGQHLLVHGMARLYVLGDLDKRLEELAARIQEGDGQAYFARAKIRSRLQMPSEALNDLAAGYEILLEDHSLAEAHKRMFAVIDAMDLAQTTPNVVIDWTLKMARAEQGQRPTDNHLRDRVLLTALAGLQEKDTLNASELLELAPYCRSPELSAAAESALLKVVVADDEGLLRDALETTDPYIRKIVRAGLAAALRKADKPRLLKLLESKNESERLAGATALAIDAHREALPVLGNLLTSRDQDVREKAISLLRQLTGKSFQFDPKASVYRRRRATTNWQAWINSEGKTASLNSANAKPKDAGKFTPRQVDALINGGLLIDAFE